MTEAEWLDGTHPSNMLRFLKEKASERKFRLFAVACCRRVWHLMVDERSRKAIDAVEWFADGLIDKNDFASAIEPAYSAEESKSMTTRAANNAATCASADDPHWAADVAANYAADAVAEQVVERIEHLVDLSEEEQHAVYTQSDQAGEDEEREQCGLLREVIGNPFRSVEALPVWLAWNNGTIPKIAQAIYDDRTFDRMPILADALEDAGSDNADIIAHCRGPGPHVRGCWVVDLLLGKS